MIRRMTYAFAMTVGLLGALIVPTALPASAVPYECSIVLSPAISVVSPHTLITGTLASNCQANDSTWASWKVRHASYGQNGLLWYFHPDLDYSDPRSNTDSVSFLKGDPYGTYYALPSSAYDNNDAPLTQNTASYVVKSGSKIYLSAVRTRSYVTLSVRATYYNVTREAFLGWPYAKVQLQYKACSTCSWTYLRNAYTASNGSVNFRVHSPRTLSYRAVTYSSALIWGRASAVAIR